MGIIKYIKDASREIHHVVWPTHKETKKYMIIVATTIILSTIFIYLLSIMFENSFFALRNYVQGNEINTITTETTNQNIQDLVDSGAIEVKTGDGNTIKIKAEANTVENKITLDTKALETNKDTDSVSTK